MRLTKLDRILAADGELQPLIAKTRDLSAAAGVICAFLSPELARQVRVANLKDGELALLASNSAAAAKLKLLGPALSQWLQKRRFQVNSVSVRVQPKRPREPDAQGEKAVHFSTHALASLRALHERMRPSPARESLARMLRRHGALPER